MEFRFTEEQELFRDFVRKFMKKEVTREYVRKYDTEKKIPLDVYRKMADLGWLGIPFPEEYGGSGGDAILKCILLEEASKAMTALAGAYSRSVTYGGESIYAYGSEEQKKKYLPALCKGEMLFAMALTEPNAGSDAASIITSAVPDGNDFIINGQKMFSTGANVADRILTVVKTDKKADAYKSISIFLIDRRSKGLEVRLLDMIGQWSANTTMITFDNVRVSGKDLCGPLNEGWKNLLVSLELERYSLAAAALGTAEAAFDDALQYAKEREQFGRKIGKFQAIRHMLADMEMDLKACHLLTYKAAWQVANGIYDPIDASVAKLFTSEALMRVVNKGMEILGGYSMTMEYDMQRYYRDLKMFEIGGGTSEIQRNIIAKQLGL